MHDVNWWMDSEPYKKAPQKKKIQYEEAIRKSKLIENIDRFVVSVKDITDKAVVLTTLFREDGLFYHIDSSVLVERALEHGYIERKSYEVVHEINKQIDGGM